MSLVVGIKSCQRDRQKGFHEAIRQTWGKDLPEGIALRFFMGGESGLADEIGLGCPDDYQSLPLKTNAILCWFLQTEFTHIYLCDNDTFLIPSKFFSLDYKQYDYIGRFGFWPTGSKLGTTFRYDDGQGNIHDPCFAWGSGGYGYIVSKKAAQIIVNSPIISWAEDLNCGQALGKHVISGNIKGKDYCSDTDGVWHFVKEIKPFEVSEIYEAYNNGKPAGRKWRVK